MQLRDGGEVWGWSSAEARDDSRTAGWTERERCACFAAQGSRRKRRRAVGSVEGERRAEHIYPSDLPKLSRSLDFRVGGRGGRRGAGFVVGVCACDHCSHCRGRTQRERQ